MTLSVRLRHHVSAFALDVAFEAPKGITVLFGPSGSGKSTTLRIIAGLELPHDGRVAVGDRVWLDRASNVAVPVHQRAVGYVFQSLALFPHLSGIDNVAYGIPREVSARDRRARAIEMLSRMKVPHLTTRKPTTYSGGEAQRVALARTFAMSPEVVLLDEPFSAMDRELRRDLCLDVRAMIAELRVPAVMVTHHRNEARLLGDQLVKLSAGRVDKIGPPEDLLREEEPLLGGLDFVDTPMPEERRTR
jgi:molybdate transport system ATP-binding protein